MSDGDEGWRNVVEIGVDGDKLVERRVNIGGVEDKFVDWQRWNVKMYWIDNIIQVTKMKYDDVVDWDMK